jgi:hypothetical protein
MALKAAQQETEGYEGVRQTLSGGAPDDPTKLLQYGKQGRATYESLIKGRKEQLESAEKKLTLAGQVAGYVRDNPTPENFTSAVGTMLDNGILTRQQAQKVLADAGNDPNKIKSYAERAASDAIKEADKLSARTRIQAANISAAPGHRNASVAEQRFKMDQDEAATIAKILGGGGGVAPAAPAPFSDGGGGGVPMPAPAGGVEQPVTGAVTQPNVLATQVAPTTAPAPNVNALNATPQIVDQISALIRTGKPKAIQAADALIKEYNIRNPAGKIEQDAGGNLIKVNERTGKAEPVIGPDGKPVKGSSPYESAFTGAVGKIQAENNQKVVTAAQSASANIQKIDSTIELLKTGDPTTGLGAELRTNIDRARALFAGDIKAGKKVADTQILDALLGSDVFPMIQSLGIGARGLDTPAERDYLRQVMTGTIQMDNKALIRLSEIRRNIETRAIEKYNTQLEKGELNKFFETQGIKPEKIEMPKMVGGGNTVSVGGNTYTFPNAEAAAKFKKDAGVK